LSIAIGLGDSTGASSAEYPRVTGEGSYGIFMGDQKNVNVAADNIFALLGGRIVLDPDTTSAANVNVSNGAQQLELDVQGDIGAVNYCDEAGNSCFTPASVGGVSADSLDFDDFVDAMALDASTSITADNAEVLSIVNTGTGNSFLVEDVASDTTPFVIAADGKVGIGTTSPSNELTISGSTDAPDFTYGQLGIKAAANDGDAFISFLTTETGSDGLWSIGAGAGGGSPNTNFRIAAPNGIGDVMNFQQGGNVGIGTTSPQSALHVPDGKYIQAEDNNAGAPAAGDCDADAERGRISLDTSNNRMYVCMGATRGWDYATLTD
jgi:hypothetical protein